MCKIAAYNPPVLIPTAASSCSFCGQPNRRYRFAADRILRLVLLRGSGHRGVLAGVLDGPVQAFT